jgi:L-threonylcarbamoyladenylate synthase
MKTVDLQGALELLKEGKTLIFPTETSYALGCDATNDTAVERVVKIKGRPNGKGTPFLLPSQMDPEEFVDFSPKLSALAERFWPGPFNIVAPRSKSSTASARCETDGTQAVRKSSHPVAAELASKLGQPIVATSANRADRPSIYTAAGIREEFKDGELPDGFLDVGDLPITPVSTIVKEENGEVMIVRQGGIVL